MTTGSVFTLMINDGKQDALLNATQYLQKRIKEIYVNKVNQTYTESQAYFADPANSQNPGFADDFNAWKIDPAAYALRKSRAVHTTLLEISKTHKMHIGRCYKPFVAMAYSYMKQNEKQGSMQFGGEVKFTIPQHGTWIHDMVLHVKIKGLRANDSRDKVKFCAFPGHRLIDRVQFIVGNVPIAEYTSELYNKHYQYNVSSEKKSGWLRNMGQEIPHLAYLTPDPLNNEYREYRWFGDGPQTLKREHEELDMYIPLLFWFNLDVAQSFPNIKIPKGKVEISVRFAPVTNMVSASDYGGGGAYTAPTISLADLYIMHINTLPEIAKVMLDDYNFSLIRVHKTHEQIVNQPNMDVHLKELKYPVENITVAFRPLENYNNVDNWYRNTKLTPVYIYTPVALLDTNSQPPTPTLGANLATYTTESNMIDSCGLQINSNDIFVEDTVKMFSSMFPLAAVGLNTPEDQGWLLFNLQFKPTEYDPSGHINTARNRAVYLNYKSSRIDDQSRARMILIAQSINFLTVHNNTAYLKYV